MSNDDTDIDVTFYDNFVPRLKAGEYTVRVSQALGAAAGADVPAAPQEPVTQKFIVRGPRFQLDPADVHRVFPPAGGTGFYDEYLPMIVLNKRALPWERELGLQPDNPACPWVALVLFSENDLPAPGPPGSLNNPTRTTSVPLNQVVAGRTPGPPAGTLGPALVLEDDEDPAKIFCNVIDVPVASFVGLMPVAADLPLLAHVRQVSTLDKEPQDAKHDGWYSSVIANRFSVPPPATGNASQMGNIVHLVSLEGFEHYLQSDGTVATPAQQTVRLISLYSWSFACLRDPAENFSALMLNLIEQVNGARPDLLLRLPLGGNDEPPTDSVALSAYTRLRDGYAPMSYASQTGEQSFAWYRGPLAPVVAEEFLETPGPGAAENSSVPTNTSEAMIFDAATGVFDLSYAVAFQTGRSLALNSLPFSTALLQWRREAHAAVDLLMERMRSDFKPFVADGLLKSDGSLTGVGVTDLAALLDNRLVSNAFQDYLATDFYHEVATHVGRTGGYTSDDTDAVLTSAASRRPVVPADLLNLTLQPPVASLLQHLSGLTNFGTTAAAIGPGATTVPLQSPGATEAMGAGAELVLASPDGETVALVKTAAAVAVGDEQVLIASSNSPPPTPAGSVLQLRDADNTAELIVDWLARIALLYGVPFNNLVADERMLPRESIRFFYLDENWINALLDGALSVGTQSSRDGLFNQLMREPVHRSVDATLCQVRGALLKQPAAAASANDLGTPAGFVLRSAVVSGWPGLEVRAYSGTDQSRPMKPLRLDRVAPDVMVCIYPGVPQRVEFDEPSEGLVFGTEDEGVDLRYVPGAGGETSANIGRLVEPKVTLTRADFPWRTRPGSPDTLRVGAAGGMADKLWQQFAAHKLVPPAPFGPAAFAVQMVRVPEQMLFLPQNGDTQ
jgi:hypothetical protein